MISRFSAYSPGQVSDQEESERLASLWDHHILDSEPEKSFDDLAEAAAKACAAPFALVTFVDKDRQWFKAKIGIDLQETGREHSFCHFCIQNKGHILEIPDAHEHELFSANPLVKEHPYIRFYAGAPIQVKEGYFLGTVCVLGQRPRTLSSEQRRILQILADRACDELENRSILAKREKKQQQEISRRVVENEVEEHRRIGQDLHDGVVQTLAAARMHVDPALDDERSETERKESLHRLRQMIDHASEELREVGHSLMGKKVREEGLQSALQELARDHEGLEGAPEIDVRFRTFDQELGELEAIYMFRVVQEFVQNSIKHASATKILVQAGMKRKQFWMRVEDDGKGMDPDLIAGIGGLNNMEHRIRSLGGHCEWKSAPGRGLTLKVTLDHRWKAGGNGSLEIGPDELRGMGKA